MSDGSKLGRQALATRFLLYFAIAYTSLIGLMGFVIMASVRSAMVEVLTDRLVVEAELVQRSIPSDTTEWADWARAVAIDSGARLTLIEESGLVVADSHSDPATMENHGDRPEVAAALTGEIGRSARRSETTEFEQHYVALPPENGLIVRMSLPQVAVQSDIARIRTFVVATGVIVGLLGVMIVAVLARRLAGPIANLTSTTIAISEGDHSVRPARSSVVELDALGQAISRLVDQMGNRLVEAEQATDTMEVVLGALSEGTVLVDPDGKVAYANPAAYELLGAIPDEVTGLVPYAFQKAIRDSREKRAPMVQDVEHGKPARLLSGMTTPFVGDDRVLLMIADVTERERMATVRRDFVANASHELKTPVSSIVASSEALRIAVGKDQESAKKFSRQIEDSALQLNRLVSDLLDLSRLEREKPVLDLLELHLLVAEEVERIRDRATEAGIELDTDFHPVSVMGSRRDLAIAVRNLLENAVRYTHATGRISISVYEEGDDVLVSVADTGEGIPTRDHERVFERFYRVDTARSRGSGGTGLGLSIVKHVVEGHGGTVDLESELGVGSTFRILLPAPRPTR